MRIAVWGGQCPPHTALLPHTLLSSHRSAHCPLGELPTQESPLLEIAFITGGTISLQR